MVPLRNRSLRWLEPTPSLPQQGKNRFHREKGTRWNESSASLRLRSGRRDRRPDRERRRFSKHQKKRKAIFPNRRATKPQIEAQHSGFDLERTFRRNLRAFALVRMRRIPPNKDDYSRALPVLYGESTPTGKYRHRKMILPRRSMPGSLSGGPRRREHTKGRITRSSSRRAGALERVSVAVEHEKAPIREGWTLIDKTCS